MPDYVEDAEPDAQLNRRTPERPGTDQPAEQTSTLGRLTPARYRFSAAAAYHGNHATPNMGPRLAIGPALVCAVFSVKSRRRPRRCGEDLLIQGKKCILFRVTRRELAESRKITRHCWSRAPRHYSASRLVVTRAVPTAPLYQCLCRHATRFPTQGRLLTGVRLRYRVRRRICLRSMSSSFLFRLTMSQMSLLFKPPDWSDYC